MKQLWSVFIGSLVVMGYFAFESILFGTAFWFIWNGTNLGALTTIGNILWIQGVALIFVIKILKFDSGKLNQQTPPIILTKEFIESLAKKDDQ